MVSDLHCGGGAWDSPFIIVLDRIDQTSEHTVKKLGQKDFPCSRSYMKAIGNLVTSEKEKRKNISDPS